MALELWSGKANGRSELSGSSGRDGKERKMRARQVMGVCLEKVQREAKPLPGPFCDILN